MAATPDAPAVRQEAMLASETPPSAKSGIGEAAAAASSRRARPVPGWTISPRTHFSKTGPKRMRSTPAARAARTSGREWVLTLRIGARQPAEQKRVLAAARLVAVQPPGRCTPSALAARARSAGPFRSSRGVVPGGRARRRATVRARRSAEGRSFSRICRYSTPERERASAWATSEAER